MSALLVSEVSTRRDYWRNTAVTPTKIQSSWRRIFVDRSYLIGPFLLHQPPTVSSKPPVLGTCECHSPLGILRIGPLPRSRKGHGASLWAQLALDVQPGRLVALWFDDTFKGAIIAVRGHYV